jgi:hypothetical protein
MDYIRTLTTTEESLLLLKATKDKTTIVAMLDTKIAQYLLDVSRDVGRDDLSEVMSEIADPVKLARVKAFLKSDTVLT